MNNSLDETFVFAEVSPTPCLPHAKFESVEALLKGQSILFKDNHLKLFHTTISMTYSTA